MQTWSRDRRLVASLLAILPLLVPNCQPKNPVEDVKLIINVGSAPTIITGAFVNAATGDPIGLGTGESVSVNVEGLNKNSVVTLTGELKTSFATEDGFVSFAIDENRTPTVDAPLEIVIVAHADGYLSGSKRLLIGKTGGHAFTLPMVKMDDPPEGVSVITETEGETDQTGAVLDDVFVQTPPDAITQAYASVRIPNSTVIKDEAGDPLHGNLTTTLVYFNNVSESSLASFPGGFSVRISKNESGNPEEAFFTTGGFIAVDIRDDLDRQAKTFSSPIELTIQIPGGTINPEMDQQIKNGDTIDVWSYDSNTGEWEFEVKGTALGPDTNGNFTVTYQVTHLTIWNLDWKDTDCDVGVKVIIVGKDNGECIIVKMKQLSTGAYKSELEVCDNEIQFIRVPPNMPVRLEAYDDCGNFRGSVDIANLCADLVYTLNVTPPPLESGTLSVKVTGVCTNRPEIQFRPTMPVWYWDQSGCRWIYAGLMTNGQITITGLNVPGTYTFAVVYDETLYWAIIEIREDFSVYVPASEEVYNPVVEDHTLSYEVEMPLDFCAYP